MTMMNMKKENSITAKSYWEHISFCFAMPFSTHNRPAASLNREKVK